MSAQATIRLLLHLKPFEPFRVVTSSGKAHLVSNSHLVALMKSQVFITKPNSDQRSYLPYAHFATIETVRKPGDGRPPRGKRRK